MTVAWSSNRLVCHAHAGLFHQREEQKFGHEFARLGQTSCDATSIHEKSPEFLDVVMLWVLSSLRVQQGGP